VEIKDVAAIVTGGASGLGHATARTLADRGARVFVLDLPAAVDKADAVDGVKYLAADVTDPEQVQAAVDAAVGSGEPLRLVVNCAGVGWASRILGKQGPHDLNLFRKVIEINLIGTFNVMRLAAAAMAQTDPLDGGQRGVIVNTASVAAFDGQIGQAAYAASKGGVASLTLTAARDLASHGIRVVTIAPGIIDTPMLAGVTEEFRTALAAGVPFPKRLGTPEEYAKLAAFLVEHDYLNGEVIRMDGALRMTPR
jgi:NAD(P)-dependent dehydrogenase (short-subunit alcohol dehydrogenase family)